MNPYVQLGRRPNDATSTWMSSWNGFKNSSGTALQGAAPPRNGGAWSKLPAVTDFEYLNTYLLMQRYLLKHADNMIL